MRRPLQVVLIAGAVLAAGGTLWAIASSDFLGRYIQTAPAPTAEAPSGGPAVAAVSPKMPDAGTAAGPREELAIEVARIEAGGGSVLAGRSPANHRVTVLANGREIGTTIATDDGQWAIVIDGGIGAGPLELGIKSRSVAGGSEVVGAPRHLDVPPSRVAAPTGTKVPAPVRAAVVPAPGETKVKTAAAAPAVPATSPSAAAPAPAIAKTSPSPTKSDRTEKAADDRALERFAALVEQARSAEAARQRSAAPEVAPTPHAAPAASASPLAANAPSAAPSSAPVAAASKLAAATPPVHRPADPSTSMDSEPGRLATNARATVPAPIPVPITFVTDQTALTENGSRAAALLAEYLRLKRPSGISLSGHADARGPDGYNMRLSLRRLEAIQRYLRAAGYDGKLSLEPRGKREPYQGIDRRRLPRHLVHQADRRVELTLTQ